MSLLFTDDSSVGLESDSRSVAICTFRTVPPRIATRQEFHSKQKRDLSVKRTQLQCVVLQSTMITATMDEFAILVSGTQIDGFIQTSLLCRLSLVVRVDSSVPASAAKSVKSELAVLVDIDCLFCSQTVVK